MTKKILFKLFFRKNQTLFREAKCKFCKASLRNNAVAAAILSCILSNEICLKSAVKNNAFCKLSIFEAASRGSINKVMSRCKNYVCSEYFDGIKSGDWKDGVLCENLEQLSFENETFDLVITEDVLEHVSDYITAFSEINRVLRVGGFHIFTVPLHEGRKTVLRKTKNGTNIFPEVMHGDYLRSAGIPVHVDFGDDLLNNLSRLGFNTTKNVFNKWYENDEITKIFNPEDYAEYRKNRYLPSCYFRYNNIVLLSQKI